jgi:hypothetical protein
VRDAADIALAYVYCPREAQLGSMSARHLTLSEARAIAQAIAAMPALIPQIAM